MKPSELKSFDKRQVVVTLRDGSRRAGRFYVTPEEGLYHVLRDPEAANEVVGGFVEDLHAGDIASIAPLP
jgi:hypothetical protein